MMSQWMRGHQDRMELTAEEYKDAGGFYIHYEARPGLNPICIFKGDDALLLLSIGNMIMRWMIANDADYAEIQQLLQDVIQGQKEQRRVMDNEDPFSQS